MEGKEGSGGGVVLERVSRGALDVRMVGWEGVRGTWGGVLAPRAAAREATLPFRRFCLISCEVC